MVRSRLLSKPPLKIESQQYADESVPPFRAAMFLQDTLQSFLFCKLAHLAQHCGALFAFGNDPTRIAIDDQVSVRNQERLFKDRVAELFEHQEALCCWLEILLEQA